MVEYNMNDDALTLADSESLDLRLVRLEFCVFIRLRRVRPRKVQPPIRVAMSTD